MSSELSGRMVKVSTAVLVSAFAGGTVSPARADDIASSWVKGFNNQARLVAGQSSGGSGAGATYAAIEIALPAGWKTYWRNPGEAGGVPPEFDFAGSDNLAPPVVLYPAPHRLIDPKAGENIGYKDHVVFPFALSPKDKSKPVSLKVKASYGVCKDLCVPAEAELTLEVPAEASPSPLIDTALRTIPVAMKSGNSASSDASKAPRLKSWRIDGEKGHPKLVLESLDPGGADRDAFLFSSDGLYMPMTKKTSESSDGVTYEADLTEGAKPEELKGKTISVTLVGSKGQSETFFQLP